MLSKTHNLTIKVNKNNNYLMNNDVGDRNKRSESLRLRYNKFREGFFL